MEDKINHLLVADIGSTTTKVLLIENAENNFRYVSDETVPTTVEYPYEDVNIALLNAVKTIQIKSGVRILNDKDDIIIPLYATSSAGGGLQIMVFGLTKAETGKLAQMTAYGAGGIISETFTADDKKSNFEKIRMVAYQKPDMILMAGGVDGGGIWGSILQSQILLLSDPEPKFNKGNKIPFIFCGNTECRTYIKQMLEKKYDLHFTENIRPNINEINLSPAKQKIHEIFIEKVIENAPGYVKLKESVRTDIMPTPVAVEKTLNLLHKKLNKNIILIDIGGATTDIFTQIGETTSRTVSANIGLSYSISNILKETGIEKIKKHIPDEINEGKIRNYIGNKTLSPSYLPVKNSETIIESACAVEGIKTAWESHKKMQFEISNINFIEKRRKEIYSVFGKWEEIFVMNEETEFEKRRYFQMSDVDMIIGAGGIFAGTDSKEGILYLLNESILPSGVTKFYIDKSFRSPHTGLLSLIDEEKALRSYMDNSLKEIGYSIVPMGPVKKNKVIIRLLDMYSNEVKILKGGEHYFASQGGHYEIILENNFILSNKNNSAIYEINTDKPILFDCRGREKYFIDQRIDIRAKLKKENSQFDPIIAFASNENVIEKGFFNLNRSLAYQGKINVKIGESVIPETLIGENIYEPPNIFVIDLKRLVGYGKIETKFLLDGLLIKAGDTVFKNQAILKLSFALGKEEIFYSTVGGIVEQIDKTGVILIKEDHEYANDPIEVNLRKELNIPDADLCRFINFKRGEFVSKNQILATREKKVMVFNVFGLTVKEYDLPRKKEDLIVRAPKAGFIKEYDSASGKLIIHYDFRSKPQYSLVHGVISESDDLKNIIISTKGTMIYGKVGFGKESYGKLKILKGKVDESFTGCIMVSFIKLPLETIQKAKEFKVKGILAASADALEIKKFIGEELTINQTGNENIEFPIVITQGFGELGMPKELMNLFIKSENKNAALFGSTRLRTGVIRPKIMINEH
ncbi:MAG: glutamate mutase L [Candidatus Delongbacteria bacterium]|jgi:uncharacterized protein (TIGR01319 family)|nr:glutamate mutase L [Candidatus Delongbacteria bacterium]MDD4205444.1 glutamate mutase L [Candidatus Delongbacteria bacterium]MDY0016457.1 glutamate mutase L [Candidatus Delongbacteria bacterium]